MYLSGLYSFQHSLQYVLLHIALTGALVLEILLRKKIAILIRHLHDKG